MITHKRAEFLTLRALQIIKKRAPVDTGNLRDSIRVREINPFVYEIYVNWGGDPYLRDYPRGIAPYMPFTNEPWISPRWNGRRNPNQGWWDDACMLAIDYITQELQGKLIRNDRSE